MVLKPRHRRLHDLAVYAGIAAKMILFGPIFKVEQVAEELECSVLVEPTQAECGCEMTFEQSGCFLQLGQHPRRVVGVLGRFLLDALELGRLNREAPMQVDAAEAGSLVQMGEPVTSKDFCNSVPVLRLARQVIPGKHTGVLIEARAFRNAAKRTLDCSDAGVELKFGQTLFVDAGEGK